MQLTTGGLILFHGGQLTVVNELEDTTVCGEIAETAIEYECRVRIQLSWAAMSKNGPGIQIWTRLKQDKCSLEFDIEDFLVGDLEEGSVGLWSPGHHQAISFFLPGKNVIDPRLFEISESSRSYD